MTVIEAMKDLADKEEAVAKSRRTLAKVLDAVNKHTEGRDVTHEEAFFTDDGTGPLEDTTEEKEPKKGKEVKEAEPEKEVTVEDVRAVLAQLSQDGKTDKVKELLTKYDAVKLSMVDPEKLPALLADAKAVS